MSKLRRFQVARGVVTLPQAVKAGPGRTNLRLQVGETFDLEPFRVERTIRKWLANGDIVEVTNTVTATTAAPAEPVKE